MQRTQLGDMCHLPLLRSVFCVSDLSVHTYPTCANVVSMDLYSLLMMLGVTVVCVCTGSGFCQALFELFVSMRMPLPQPVPGY